MLSNYIVNNLTIKSKKSTSKDKNVIINMRNLILAALNRELPFIIKYFDTK